jgi:16S rRNA (cytosine967-C5)-methyltransferase
MAQQRGLSPSDRAMAMAIAGETLRRLPDLDGLIDSAMRQPLADDSKARMVLRLALAQKVGLGTPDHALVSTALPLVDGGPRRLVHGVLGTLLRGGLPALDEARLPSSVEARWSAAWGDATVQAARRQILQRPALDLSFANAETAVRFAETNGGRSLASRHVRLASSDPAALPGFNAGDWWVQDLAASLPARLIPSSAVRVLDLCAAPGGKTMQLAAAGHDVTALDRSDRRFERLRDNLRRTGLNAQLVVDDAATWRSRDPFDAVLLDAPCSATGTFRRHPEVLYRARAAIITESAALQAALLGNAATLVRPGGTLVYAVCSLEPEEGETAIDAFLAANGEFELAPPQDGELPDFVTPTDRGWVRILPGTLESDGGLDGFFIARLVRTR